MNLGKALVIVYPSIALVVTSYHIQKISKGGRIPLAGLFGNQTNFNFPIDVLARGKQIMMDI